MSYNKDTSRKYGWEPSWFGADDFGPELDQKVKEFQRSLGIKADGLVRRTLMTMSRPERTLFIMASSSLLTGKRLFYGMNPTA